MNNLASNSMNKTTKQKQASLFLAHGGPDLVISDIPARSFLETLGEKYKKPTGIVMISAHWRAKTLQITPPTALDTIHDFSGFTAELYERQYPASGADSLSERVSSVLHKAGYESSLGSRTGLDHGAWVPLSLMYPSADIPIVQLSLLHQDSPELHFNIGQALESLRHENIMIIGSGGLVHNLRLLKPEGAQTDSWAESFDAALYENIRSNNIERLLNYRQQLAHSQQAHPTEEHIMPLFVALGAGGVNADIQRLHHSFSYANLSMSSYQFD